MILGIVTSKIICKPSRFLCIQRGGAKDYSKRNAFQRVCLEIH
jgi:hypothetical protein